ncbi:MAG: ATP-dependent DNA helicase RecG, partial [Anaerolineae bacterium]|nr:ATP-dependent DNA helicase RecG [Anaerolineae bacterium]
MPSALETLIKILKLEREQGFRNSAVIGGLGAYSSKWKTDAHAQARRPEHHILVDELFDILSGYDTLPSRDERLTRINYMIDRITGRVPPPPEYLERIPAVAPPAPSPPAEDQPPPRPEREERSEHPPRHERQQEKQPERPPERSQERQQGQPEQRRERGGSRDGGKRRDGGKQPFDKPKAQARESLPGKSNVEGGITRDDDFSRLEFDTGGERKPVKSDLPAPVRLARPPRKPRKQIDPQAAADIMRGLNAPVDKVKGVGPKMAQLLNKLGIATINDLLFFLPRRYDDYTQLSQIGKLQPNVLATIIGTVRYTELRIARGGRKDFFMTVDDGTATMSVTFFGQYYLNRQVRVDQQVVLRGQTSMFQNRIQMTNPEIQYLELEDLQKVGIVPVYPLTDGLNRRSLRKLMQKTVDYWAEQLPDYMPEGTLERADLADLGWAIRNLHFPESWDHLDHAQRRFIFDELLLMQLTIMANRRSWQAVPSQQLQVSDEQLQAFVDAIFPYPLTGAQRRSIEDIRADLTKPIPMNRLLQGDVGSGKTAVAATMLGIALINGRQAALMAPTSILAEQHFRSISAMFDRMPEHLMSRAGKPVIALLTGSVTSMEREAIYRGLADGSIDIVIGTHAVIQEGVEFNDLAAAIIDEQHRFGVEQRGALRGKGINPHLLVMTATPIPRTLALTLYADLDLSIIDEMPPGRIPIRTRVIEPPQRERAYHFVETQLEEGRQAFIVYPLVEASETIEAESAVEAFDKLQRVFYHHKVGLLHGRMKPAEKDAVMEQFRSHEFDVLVTTSVAEVGVDIPNASIIVIDGANRFGLAQLHQFRGRVGRGGHASYCLLVCDTPLEEARERLLALEQTNDGFKLAEIDWKLRGPGDLIGTKQSGQAELKLLEQMKPELVELAQREARTIFEDD